MILDPYCLRCSPDRLLHGHGGETDLDVVDDHNGQSSTDSNTSCTVPVVARAGRESTDVNTSSVVPAGSDTHVVHGRESLTVKHSSVKQSKKKKSVDFDMMRRRIIECRAPY